MSTLIRADVLRDDNDDGVDIEVSDSGQVFVVAYNEGGHNSTRVDLVKLLSFVRSHPDLRHVTDSLEGAVHR